MKRFLWPLLFAVLAGLLGPVPSARAASPVPAGLVFPAAGPAVTGASNFRDAAGDGLVLASGRHMATGVVYRSSRLFDLTAEDITLLESLGIAEIIDLRTSGVAAGAPDPVIGGARYTRVSLFAGRTLSTSNVDTAAEARAHMRELNRRFVTISAQRRALARVLRMIAAADGPVIIHCTEGKDRTGWVSAMLQVIAGAGTDAVVEQYLLSNTYRAADIARRVEAARVNSGERRAAVVKELQTVRASYLEAGLTQARRQYGSLYRYLTRGVGLTKAEIAALRARLRTA